MVESDKNLSRFQPGRSPNQIYIPNLNQYTEKLQNSKEAFRLLFEQSVDGIIIIVDSKIVMANPAFCEIYGTTIDDIIGRGIMEFIHPDNRELAKKRIVKLLKGGTGYESKSAIYQGFNTDGELIWVEVSSKPIEWGGRPALQSIVRDITERKHAEQALKESEEKFRDLAELLPETIFLTDEKGNLTFVNRAGLEAFGYTVDEYKNGFNVIQALAYEDRDRALENISKLSKNEPTIGREYMALRKDGTKFPVIVYANSVIKEGNRVGMRGILVDITERKQAERQIEKTLLEKKILLRELKHRVNNNLQLLKSMISMWVMETDDDSVKEALQEVEGLITTMALVHTEAQFDEGAKGIRLQEFLRNLTKGIIGVKAHSKLNITCSIEGDEVWLGIDQMNPLALISNEIMVNSIKHAFNGQSNGYISISLKKIDNIIKLSIKDNGIGISPEIDLKKPDTFGLELVQNLVEQLNGKLKMIVDNGTNIIIEFPKGG
jgi:PAS domain S-box-containing protein